MSADAKAISNSVLKQDPFSQRKSLLNPLVFFQFPQASGVLTFLDVV
jgi:hypothetical protein